jgi:hypothetical protein
MFTNALFHKTTTKNRKSANYSMLSFSSFPTRYTLVQQGGKMNIKKVWNIYKNWMHSENGRIRRLVAFEDWSHFGKFGDSSFGEWSFEDWSFGDWLFGEWSFGDWSVYQIFRRK